MAGPLSAEWTHKLRLNQLDRGIYKARLEATEAERAATAARLDLLGIARLEASITARAWLDGVEITGRVRATVTYECGVTLDPFDEEIDAEIFLRAVPAGSPNAPTGEPEAVVDPEAEDPPDVLEGQEIDLADVASEHLALSLDPFPRKPGAVFEAPPAERESSPFDVLKALKPKDPS